MDNRIFLTFDIDWAADFVVQDLINFIEGEEIYATFFCTHHNELFEKLKSHKFIELGLHPNYNPLLNGDAKVSAIEIVTELKNKFQNAISIRSHSLFQNSTLFGFYKTLGIKIDSNTFVPSWSEIKIKPYYEVNGILRAPYIWEDDIHAYAVETGKEIDWNCTKFLNIDGLKIFDFHPIHVFLNTEKLSRYDNVREKLNNLEVLKNNQYLGEGTRTFLQTMVKEWKKRGGEFCQLKKMIE